MVNRILSDEKFESFNANIPNDVINLSKIFWGNGSRYPFKIKKSDWKAVHIPGTSEGKKYFLFKILNITKSEPAATIMGNRISYIDNISQPEVEFFLNDDGLTIRNTDGTFEYNYPSSKDAQIFGIIESAFADIPIDGNTYINIYFYQGEFDANGNFDTSKANENHAYFHFYFVPANPLNLILKPINTILNLFRKRKKPFFGGSSAGVRVPPRHG